MINGLPVASVALLLSAWSHAQEASTPSRLSEIERLVAGLSDDTTWERDAARLVMLRELAAKPLGERLLEVAKEDGNEEVSGRILRVLERIGLGGSAATEHVLQSMRVLPKQNVGMALLALTQISPVGGRYRQNDLMIIFRRMQGKTLKSMRDERIRHFKYYFNTCSTQLEAKSKTKPDLAMKSLVAELRQNRSLDHDMYCQMLATKGTQAKAAVPEIAKWLRAYVRAGGHAKLPHKSHPWIPRIHFAHYASDAILSIDPTGKDAALARGYLIYAEPFRDLRLRSARELMLLGAHVGEAVPLLVQYLKKGSEDHEIVRVVINCLAMAGPAAIAATGQLEALTESKDEKTAARAKSLLSRIRSSKQR